MKYYHVHIPLKFMFSSHKIGWKMYDEENIEKKLKKKRRFKVDKLFFFPILFYLF